MLRITKSRSASAARAYFRRALQRADYYLGSSEIAGCWRGLGSAHLGLAGEVSADAFVQLLGNRTPQGEKLTPRDRADRIPGMDFTISAPKSVSLLWAVTADPHILDAHRFAVREMMAEVERHMEARVRRGRHAQSQATRKTGNAIWAEFEHETARPVDGVPDPQLHTHCYVVNATFDDAEHRWKAAEIGNIAADHIYFEAVYQSALAHQMRRLGFGVERHGRWWDVAGVGRPLIEKFSRRTAQIEEHAAAEGPLSPAQKAQLGVHTRSRKSDATAGEDLHASWRERLTRRERRALDRLVRSAEKGTAPKRRSVIEAWRYGLDKALAHHSVASEKRVLADALRYGFGDVRLRDLEAASTMTSLLAADIDGRTYITTRDILDEEKRLIALARSGRASCDPLGHGAYQISDPRLNDGQRAAIAHIWHSPDRAMVIRGGAGVGKTKGVIAEAVNGLLAADHAVYGFAPTGTAVDELRQDVVEQADTVALLLKDERRWDAMRGAVLVIDEASLIGVRDITRILELSEAYDWRVILCGDEKQHGAVERGDAFRLLRERAGLKAAEVADIVRQKGAYRDAVKAIELGEIEEGWRRFEALGAVIETPGDKRLDEVAMDYVGEVDAGSRVLVVAPTHREKNALTLRIRDGLKSAGMLGRSERPMLHLRDARWTEAERRNGELYRPGQVVKFFQNVGPYVKGERAEVIAVRDGRPMLADGRFLPLDRAGDFKVYETGDIRLAPGDLVRITEQGRTADGQKMRTGSVYKIEGFDAAGDVILENGWKVAENYGHLDYGYVSTSHGSQGRTVDVVLASMGSQSLPATSLEQFYVTVSRGRKAARIYTDDKDAIMAATKATSHRGSALELMEGRVDKERRPRRRSERMATFVQSFDRHMRAGLEHNDEAAPADVMRQARVLAAAQHHGTLRDRGAELGD